MITDLIARGLRRAGGFLRGRIFSLATSWRADPAVKGLLQSKLFWYALPLKLVLGSLLASHYLRDLFIPFVNYFVESGGANPWAHFAALGETDKFPYPPIMLYVLAAPRWVISTLLPGGVDTISPGHLLVMRIPLLAADLGILVILVRWFPNRVRRVLVFYWWSPLVFYISYWHGQLDVIPTALFLGSLYLLRERRYVLAMVALGLALATKSHLLVAVPFLLIYLNQERGLREAAQGALTTAGVYLLAVAPFLSDPGFRQIVYGSEEQNRFFAFALSMGSLGLSVLLAPGAILLLWFRFVAYSKRNWDLLMLFLGIVFSAFIVLAPPAPGYFLWSLPFFVFFICRTAQTNFFPYYAYIAGYFVFFWTGQGSDLFDAWHLVSPTIAAARSTGEVLEEISPRLAETVHNLSFTAMQAALVGMIFSMYQLGVKSNAVYRMRTRPVLIGLAGDSGAGKDTFAALAAQVLGKERVTLISGDDYHRWPRGDEMWQVFNHLEIQANDLYRQHEDVIALSEGLSIVKGSYDHTTGRFTEQRVVDPGEYVILAGLHSLSIEGVRNRYDLKVFLDPQEDLRRLWKVRRDIQERGYEVEAIMDSLEQREAARQKYVLPQRQQADLVVRWVPKTPVDPRHYLAEPGLALEITALNTFDFTRMVDGLRVKEGLIVTHEPFVDARWQTFRVEGEIGAENLLGMAKELVPNIEEVTAGPVFVDGLKGCAQLAFLVALSDRLRWETPAGE